MCSKRMNIALLSRWLWRISQGHGGLWLDIIRNKYLRGQPLAFCQRSGGSQFWQSVVQLLPVLRIGTSISVGSGAATLFWFDQWDGDTPFTVRFPDLFSIVVDPSISVERALIDLGRLAFLRTFGPLTLPPGMSYLIASLSTSRLWMLVRIRLGGTLSR